jgi:hypothetical protein
MNCKMTEQLSELVKWRKTKGENGNTSGSVKRQSKLTRRITIRYGIGETWGGGGVPHRIFYT